MSKGLGTTQRKLIIALESPPGALDPFDLAAKVYKLRPRKGVIKVNDSQLVSIRRALRSLEKTGKVFRVIRKRRTYWANERTGLWLTIKNWQDENYALAVGMAASGKTTKQIGALLETRSKEMQSLMDRAHALGVDLSSEGPPPAMKT
jgi:hypothetical protein